MKRLFDPQLGLILVFLGIIAGVPVVQLVVEAGRGERPQVFDILKHKPTAGNLRLYERTLEDVSWVATKLRPWAQYVQFAWLRDGGDKALVGRDGWLFYGPGVHYLTELPIRHEAGSTAADAAAAIVDLRDQLAERGIRLLVMPVPNKESVYPEKLTRRAVGMHASLCPETRQLLSRLKASDVEVLDLFELFAAYKTGRPAVSEALYLAQDSHWSPTGVGLAARAAAQRVLQRGWIKHGSVSYQLQPSPTRRVGDILRMLQVPQLESDVMSEVAACSRVLRTDSGEPYQDDTSSEILVLGDSFFRIYETDEPGAGGFIAHLASELGQPVSSIVNDGGASTLVRQELSRRPKYLAKKKVVIWEFVERDVRLGTEGWQRVPLPAINTAQAEDSKPIPAGI